MEKKQFAFLNISNTVSNIATNLLGAFIPAIVYAFAPSHKVLLALVALITPVLLRMLWLVVFKNLLLKNPELAKLLRSIPLLLKMLSVLLIETNAILAVVLIAVFDSFNMLLKHLPNELIFVQCYDSKNTRKSVGLSVFFLELGLFFAQILSGYLLDSISLNIVVIISVVFYLVASLPLVIYKYYIHKKNHITKEQHKEATDALIAKVNSKMTKEEKKDMRKISHISTVAGFSTGAESLFQLLIFITVQQFTTVGLVIAFSHLLKGVLDIIIGYIKPYALFVLSFVSIGIFGVCSIFMPLALNNLNYYYVLYFILAISYTFPNVYLHHKFLQIAEKYSSLEKSVFIRLFTAYAGYSIPVMLAMISFNFSFYTCGVAMILHSIFFRFEKKGSKVHEHTCHKKFINHENPPHHAR